MAQEKKSKEAKVGLIKFTYEKNHGNSKKGDTVTMHFSTGKALEAHGIGKVGAAIKVSKKPE